MPYAQDGSGAWWEGEVGPDGQFRPTRKVPTSHGLPANPIKVQQAQGDIQNTAVTTQGKVLDNTVTAATAPAVITKAQADAETAQQGTRFNGLNGAQFSDALNQFNGALETRRLLADLKDRYKEGPGKTKGIWGLADFVPGFLNTGNERFDKSAGRLRAFAKSGTGTTGGENNSLAEMKLNLGSYIPSTYDKDKTNEDTFKAIDDLSMKGFKQAAQRLGGIPDENGNIYPMGSKEANALIRKYGLSEADFGGRPNVPNVWDQVNAQGDGPRPVAFGSTGGNDGITQPIPPEANQEYAAYYMQNAGRLNPQEYAAFRLSLAKKYGFEIPPGTDLLQEAAEMNDYYAKGGRGTPSLTLPNKEMSELDWLRNSAVNNPVGAGVANFADGVSMGGVSALTGNRMSDLAREQPKSAFAGQVAGAIAGSEGLGYVGRQLAQRALPKLLGGGRAATFGRQVAQDAAYGGAYGQNVNGDAAGGALLSGLGSAGGQVLGKVVGSSLGGLTKSPFAQVMDDAAVPMTVGQNLGGIFKATEDKAMSIPIVGDMIRRRRLESFDAFDQAARNQAGTPIGAQFAPGGNWIDELPPQFGQAYDNATAGVKVPLDRQFTADMQAARARGAALPPDFAPKFDAAVTNRVMPIAQAGELTGDTYQQAMRGLKGYKAETSRPGFEADYRDALSGVQSALKGQMQRGGGSSVVDGLASADQAYRLAKVVQNAQQRAVNGTGSGTGGVITPAQLNTAAIGNMRKFGGARPFAELGDAGQATLPSTIPDSGTAGRLVLQGATLAGLGGTGYAAGGMDGTQNALLMAALLAAGGSKAGQVTLNKALFSRPAAAKALGSAISKRKGLFGSASIPLLLESN